jgi:threonyl-tRNA synthetase
MAVVGKKEADQGTVSLRLQGGKNLGVPAVSEAVRFLRGQVEKKSLALDQ